MIYLDTSWLVKLYVNEPDAAGVRRVVDGDGDVLASDLAFVEFHAAIERRRCERTLTSRQTASVRERFLNDWARLTSVAVSREVLDLAADLVGRRALRSLDALQLASALIAAAGAPAPLRFGAADARLVAAAAAEGLATVASE